jgi:hypothetical protein
MLSASWSWANVHQNMKMKGQREPTNGKSPFGPHREKDVYFLMKVVEVDRAMPAGVSGGEALSGPVAGARAHGSDSRVQATVGGRW